MKWNEAKLGSDNDANGNGLECWKIKKGCKVFPCNLVGMTRFERATSRPPDVYSTD